MLHLNLCGELLNFVVVEQLKVLHLNLCGELLNFVVIEQLKCCISTCVGNSLILLGAELAASHQHLQWG